ncbi:hypothetical protein [Halomonas sp. YLGW01]|uniref:hypothetical protein n=1 Tax=Halomonas sp. YLGW01 TaxID=2773308 RepID=UPI001F5BC176|nr:hypothetical protein [Halomonas sp. YLGW01]
MMRRWRGRLAAWGFVALALAGCAAHPGGPEPRVLVVAAAPERVMAEGLQVLIGRGFVIRHADLDLGRLEAVLATWPGYRLRLEALAVGDGTTRLSLSGYRDHRPLVPESLYALLVELQARLPASPERAHRAVDAP